MPSSNAPTAVALRYFKHGDRTYGPGEVIPDLDTQRLSHLVDGGYVREIPAGVEVTSTVAPQEPPASPSSDEDEGAEEVDTDDTNGEEDVDDDYDPAVTPDGYDPREDNAEAVVAYVEANPEQRAAVIAAEEAGKGRKTVLAQLAVPEDDEQ